MSTQSCVICGPKRLSRARCNCCEQYLCRDHLKEHDDLLNAQLEPLIDNINQLADRLQHYNLDSLLQSTRLQLDQWKQAAFQSIEQIYEQKLNQLNELLSEQLQKLREQTVQIQTKVSGLIRDQDATNEQIESLNKTIEHIEKQTNAIENQPIELNIHPLIISDDCISLILEKPIIEDTPLILTDVIQTLTSSPANVDCIASNDTHILLHRHPTLSLFDYNLNLIEQTHPYSDLSIADMCWSLTLKRFIILTDDDVFVLDQTKMLIEKWNIPQRDKGHWHSLTCSRENLYLTAYKWGTTIYEYHIRSTSFEFNRRWQTPVTCDRDETIDHLIHNYQHQIGMIIQNRLNNTRQLQLRSDQTLECLWSIELNQCAIINDRILFCTIRQVEWLIIDSYYSQLFYISRDGLVKQTIDYPFDRPLRAWESKSNFLLVTTNRSVNLHQLL